MYIIDPEANNWDEEFEENYEVPEFEKFPDHYEKCFSPFLDDFELCAMMSTKRNEASKQYLVLRYYNPKRNVNLFELNSINNIEKRVQKPNPDDTYFIHCIHTGLTNMSIETFNSLSDRDRRLFISGSSENLSEYSRRRLNISQEVAWFSFKSWTQGIFEYQNDIFNVQGVDDFSFNSSYMIIHNMMKFILRKKPEYFNELLDKYEKDFRNPITGKLINNFNAIIIPLLENADNEQFKYILSKQPSVKVFLNQFTSKYLKNEEITQLKDFPIIYDEIKKNHNQKYIFELFENPKLFDFDEARKLFDIDNSDYNYNYILKSELSKNINAPKFEEFKSLFETDNIDILKNLAGNPNAVRFEDKYKKLFDINMHSINIRIAGNPNAVRFEDKYKQLFTSENKYVRERIASNPNASILQNEYKQLFTDISKSVRMNVASNPKSVKFDEYRLLFKDHYKIREIIAENPLSVNYTDEFKKLFKDKSINVRSKVASNYNAPLFEDEYKLLFKDRNVQIRLNILTNSNACILKNEFETLYNIVKSLKKSSFLHN